MSVGVTVIADNVEDFYVYANQQTICMKKVYFSIF